MSIIKCIYQTNLKFYLMRIIKKWFKGTMLKAWEIGPFRAKNQIFVLFLKSFLNLMTGVKKQTEVTFIDIEGS